MAINLANNNSLANITALPASITSGAMTLISEQTASGSATLSFTSGIDSTYDSYVFKFINIHPSSNGARFNFNLSVDSGSNYNVSKTSTYFNAYHTESDNSSGLSYNTGGDLANGTADQNIFRGVGAANDECIVGTMSLYNPSSTTFVKHFIIRTSVTSSDPGASDTFVAGYGNTTSAVNSVKFLFDTGNIDSGVIKLYGVS
jgi:hypothetical protein